MPFSSLLSAPVDATRPDQRRSPDAGRDDARTRRAGRCGIVRRTSPLCRLPAWQGGNRWHVRRAPLLTRLPSSRQPKRRRLQQCWNFLTPTELVLVLTHGRSPWTRRDPHCASASGPRLNGTVRMAVRTAVLDRRQLTRNTAVQVASHRQARLPLNEKKARTASLRCGPARWTVRRGDVAATSAVNGAARPGLRRPAVFFCTPPS
jgi:hypothetical protein